MKRLIPLLALIAFLPQRGSAETTLGTAITAVPYNITKAGVYHFTKNLAYTPLGGTAINIEATDVIIDLNAHELVAEAGSATTSIGIFSNNLNRVTIKNGTVRGFQSAVVLTSNEAVIDDLLVTNNFSSGITVVGDNAKILRNRVCDTGGSTSANTPVYAIGITLTGTYGTISDNDVQNTTATDNTGHYGMGIRVKDCSDVLLSNNRVLDVEPAAPTKGTSTGIATLTSDNLIFLSNTVLTTETAFDLSGGASGKYGDNTTSNITTDYFTTGSGMTSIGNNN